MAKAFFQRAENFGKSEKLTHPLQRKVKSL